MNSNRFYFIGIGGIGMSSIARYLLGHNVKVGGYDKVPSSITEELEKMGAVITYDDALASLPEAFSSSAVVVIYTPAIPKEHPQLTFFQNQPNQVLKRAAFLGQLTRETPTLAVAGTHGKTTTTAILAHLFYALNQKFTAFVGGVLKAQNANLISTGKETILVEADEFDRSFLHLNPTLGCITSVDADHLDVYGDTASVKAAYSEFASLVKQKIIVAEDVPIDGIRYSINNKADYYASSVRAEGFGYRFDLHTPTQNFPSVYFSQLGLHNLQNALAAFALASEYGLSEERLAKALASFEGVERRLQLIYQGDKHILIDDYAHHPTEINAVWETLQDAYPKSEKCAVFQPHLFSRTRDFMNEFTWALGRFDRVLLLPIYPARELPIPGISSNVLKEMVASFSKVELCEKDEIAERLRSVPEKIKVVLGAGDIGLEVQPIKEKLESDEAK